MCLNKLKFRMKNMKSIAWQAGCLLWLGMAVCNCTPASSGEDYASYVNPFIGTGGHGHTYPGAVVPNGMIQPSPRHAHLSVGCLFRLLLCRFHH